MDASYYKLFNKIVLTALTNPAKTGGNDTRFTKDNAIIVYFLIGKSNQYSVELLDAVIKVIKNQVNPFENSTKALRFLYIVIRWMWKRVHGERQARKKLARLEDKITRKK